MVSRDKYGNYVNDEGVIIKVTTDKNGNDHVSFYDGEVDKPHDAAHINVYYDKQSWTSTTHGPDKSDTENNSGGCYLTTACINHFHDDFDDNCYELTMLRWFRDNYVSVEDIKHYYEVAPIIVDTINNYEESEIIYDFIYDRIVSYCVQQIEQGNYDKVYLRYKDSVLALEEHFAKPVLMNRFVKKLKLKMNN